MVTPLVINMYDTKEIKKTQTRVGFHVSFETTREVHKSVE